MRTTIVPVFLVSAVALTACGGGTPTQPMEEGCRVTAANPVTGTHLKPGVPVTITIAGRCTATASGTAILGGVMLPSVNPTATATQPIPAGTTTVSLAIVFVPPATETSVAMLLSIIYSGGLSAPTHDSVDYPSDDATTCCALSRV